MKVRVFQSGKGDCLLLSSKAGHRVLVDGGMPDAYAIHVAPALADLAADGKQLDIVYVSHIDEDHIGGVLRLFDDTVAWRVFDYQRANGNVTYPEPVRGRPPTVAKVWHNAFAEQVGKNAGPIGDLLAQSAATLSGASEAELQAVAGDHRDLATSVNQSIRLSRRLDPEQLGIPTNPEFGGKLAFVRTPTQSVTLGAMHMTVIGPFEADLDRLRKDWNAWLKDNKKALKEISDDARRAAQDMGLSELDRVIFPLLEQAKKLGERSLVTAPNLASLMFLVEEGKTRILLTGDGHGDDIVKGLRACGALPANGGGLHVRLLKVQHHGSEHNITPAFCRTITADDYLFCGNGEHENPDLDVVRAIVMSRIGTGADLSPNPEAGDAFRLWFNSSSQVTERQAAIAHMQALETLVAGLVAQSAGRMTAQFLQNGSSFDLPVG